MIKEALSTMTVKTVLAMVIFGMGMIIIGGGYLSGERGKMLNDKIIKPETEIRVIDNEKYCEKDKDCKLIYSSCSCEAVNTSSKKTYFKTGNEPEPLCVVNLCVMNDITATCINNKCVADWQTYRNEEYGFEVKYPEDFIEQKPESDTISLETKKTDQGSSYYFRISVLKNYKINQIVSDVEEVKEINIEDHLGYEYFYVEGVGMSRVALIQFGEDALSISFDCIGTNPSFATANDRKIYVQEFFNQILSTFKFIEKEIN